MSTQGGIAVALVCAACGGQVVAPSPGTGGSTALDAGEVVTGAGGTATATGGATNARDAGGNVSDAEIMDTARAYCTACPQSSDCVTTLEIVIGSLPAACRSPFATLLRCMTAASICPIGADAVKAPPPSSSCLTEATTYSDCRSSHTMMAP
jgi:hypothetical protein